MQFRCAALAALVALLLFAAPKVCADEPTGVVRDSTGSPRIRATDGWRPVGVQKFVSNDLFVAAQSPDDDTRASEGPLWNYPPRQKPTSVAVPSFDGAVNPPKRSSSSDRVALWSPRRPAAASSGRSSEFAPATPASYQAEEPGSVPFHSSPFDRPAPVPPADPYSCRPCRPSPFDNACDAIENASWNYSWDNIYFFLIGEAFRLTDQGTRFAGRAGLNWGLPLIDNDSGLGFQFGFSGSWAEEAPQWFLTAGLFYRGDMRCDWAWNAGAVFDYMSDNELEAEVAQVRAKTSVTLDRKNELGVWGAASVLDDKVGHHTVQSVDQANLFYRYLFDSDVDVTWWVGWRSDPNSLALGISTYTPINDRWAGVFGAYYAFHGDTWNVYTGLVRHWCDRARQDYLGQDRHQPYLPVADNTSMTLFEKP